MATLLGLASRATTRTICWATRRTWASPLALDSHRHPGVEIAAATPLGAAFMNGPNSGKDVFVPLEYIIGGRK
ncbi:hypothetical protein ACPA9J_01820 [Pseudomonas aeruginosa]